MMPAYGSKFLRLFVKPLLAGLAAEVVGLALIL